jgi:hypothetical protein
MAGEIEWTQGMLAFPWKEKRLRLISKMLYNYIEQNRQNVTSRDKD